MHEQASYSLGKHWFVARTNIKCERRAQLGLNAKGFRTFCPFFTKWVSHARIKTVVERPLIPRHFFVEIDPNKEGFAPVREIDGVESLLGVCGTPSVIPRALVEEFFVRQLKGEFDYASEEPLKEGCKVAIVSGEYDDFFGVIHNAKVRNGRLLVKVLETAVIAKLSVHMVRPARAA